MAQAPVTEENVEQLFEDAFAQAAADAEKGEVTPPPAGDDQTPPAGETKSAEELAAEQKVADDAAAKKAEDAEAAAALAEANKGKTDEEIAAEQKAADDKAAVDKTADKKAVDDAAAAKAEADRKATEAATKPPEETADQKKAREEFEASIKPHEWTDDEKAALAKMQQDFPGEYKAMMAKFTAQDREINARVYQAVQAVIHHFNPRLATVEQSAQALSLEAHRAIVMAKHSDFDTVRGKLPEWIKAQSALDRPGLELAYEHGDPADVIELLDRYKKATSPVAGAKTADQIAAEQRATDEAAAKKKKSDEEAAALAPVSSKRSSMAPRGGRDPNDYDGAFAEAAAAAAGGK